MLDAENNGGWVAYANGKVDPSGAPPALGNAATLPLNGKIIAGIGILSPPRRSRLTASLVVSPGPPGASAVSR